MWGKPISGATIQIELSDSVRNILCGYQKELDALEPNNLLLIPREFQHISVNQVVFWGGKYQLGTKETWEQIAENFTSSFKHLHKSLPSFEVKFSKLVATTGGIIWCAYDDRDQMETLRNIFLQKLPFPKETKKFNHIIHTTVARYKRTLNSPQLIYEYVQSKNDTVSMKVERIFLRKENLFPSIQTEDIAHIELY